jgi:hypothetical protein
MKKMHKVLLSILIIPLYIMNSSCQEKRDNGGNGDQNKNSFTTPDSAAQKAIEVLQTLASDEKLKGTTNLTPEEVRQLKVGKAIAVHELSYDELLKANPDSVPPPVMDSTSQRKWLYPLQINNTTRTTSIVTKNDGLWKLTSAGDNAHVEILNAQRPADAAVADLIEVPGLSISFLRYQTNNGVFYSSNRSIPEVKIEKGQLIPESQALRSLVSYARIIEEKYGKDIKNKKIVD